MQRFAFDLPEYVARTGKETFQPEEEAVATLCSFLEKDYPAEKIRRATVDMVGRLRDKGAGHGVEAFLHEYPLGTAEGLALMCLAEALLRIPDKTTQEKLIESTFEAARWNEHVTLSDSWFVKASSFGLKLSGKVVEWGHGDAASLFHSLARKWGEPMVREGIRKAMHIMGTQFVMGQDVAEAKKHAERWEKSGVTLSYDMLGEGARNEAQANHYFEAYQQAIVELGQGAPASLDIHEMRSISVKLSGLHPRYHLTQWERLKEELYPKLKHLVLLARKHHLALSIDAEEAQRFDVNLWLFAELFKDADLLDYPYLGFVLQAYQKRAFYAIDVLAELSAELGKSIPVRLVKGAYWDSEIKWAQVQGLKDYPVFTVKAHTDISYLACARKLLDTEGRLQPQFATHNAYTIQAVLALANGRKCEFQRLHGMGEGVYALLEGYYPVRIYAPVGRHDALLPYLIRRLLENGANTSFVRQVMDKNIPLDTLALNPLTQKHSSPLPLPENIFGTERRNSAGVDLGYACLLQEVESGLAPFAQTFWQQGEGQDIRSPAQWQDEVGSHALTAPEQVQGMVETAQRAQTTWAKWPVEKRAQVMEHMAGVLEKRAFEACSLLMREGGRHVMDAVSELREAQDFCRYYAAEARKLMQFHPLTGPAGEDNRLGYAPRGVFLCISPWNFPLAIFLGQVCAALVTGNAVIAKPAAQTPLIACKVTEWFREAGLPPSTLQLALGEGRTVGQALVEHPAIAGVVFTGSTATAQQINRSLAAKKGAIVPLIAETGGQNAMIVDSSALLEQACDDIITSAFGSAGQRCSALRVLYVQQEVADALIALITGAMAEIRVAAPWNVATDVGPVIDKAALSRLEKHVDYLNSINALWHVPPRKVTQDGYFFPPVLAELQSISQLPEEVFGPVLHVIRYDAHGLDKAVQEINSTGYGLTFGIHSRVQSTIDKVVGQIHAGNIYVNRSMIGAVVGVQPFGGEGLSGTGFKAGGPHYLTRFVHERTRTVNTAAIGGNVELLKG